jgi:phosphoribosylanthranilate isomerase
MTQQAQLKVCGIRLAEDFHWAAEAGADALGFIFYPKSPRYISPQQYRQNLQPLSYGGLRVAVLVEPEAVLLKELQGMGFDRYQIHFDCRDNALDKVMEWSNLVGKENLWLAPRLAKGELFPEYILSHCRGVLRDTFSPDKHGGTGVTGDWDEFLQWKRQYPQVEWILAGGLSPENLEEALASADPDWVDVNSGVEASPGIKDHNRLALLADVRSRAVGFIHDRAPTDVLQQMSPLFVRHRDFLVPHIQMLLRSYRHWLKEDLIPMSADPMDNAYRLFHADRAVLSGTADEDQILNFGNLTTLRLWEMDWDTLTRMPSRYTAEPMHRDEREAFLKRVRENGYVDDYQGIRISSTGKRFRIEQATVWNLIDDKGVYCGQAATFLNYTRL